MKRAAIAILFVLLLGGLVFLGTWQGYRYGTLKRELQELEAEQRDWLEQNKKLVAALAVMGSPERIERIALKELGLKRLDKSRRTTVVLPQAAADE
jgi:cell division protein FtsL